MANLSRQKSLGRMWSEPRERPAVYPAFALRATRGSSSLEDQTSSFSTCGNGGVSDAVTSELGDRQSSHPVKNPASILWQVFRGNARCCLPRFQGQPQHLKYQNRILKKNSSFDHEVTSSVVILKIEVSPRLATVNSKPRKRSKIWENDPPPPVIRRLATGLGLW